MARGSRMKNRWDRFYLLMLILLSFAVVLSSSAGSTGSNLCFYDSNNWLFAGNNSNC